MDGRLLAMSRRHWFSLLGLVLLIFIMAIAALDLLYSFAPNNTFLIQTRMMLSEIAKPPVVRHTEIKTAIEITGHPKPLLTVDDKILKDLNCPPVEDGTRYCSGLEDKEHLESLGCYSVWTPDSLLGGLTPTYPMAGCTLGEGKYVYQSGCLISVGVGYVIERQGKYEIIDSLPKLKATFAPIESENEALSYAWAATGYSALYRKEILPDTEYFVDRLENTNVRTRNNEYVVRLYNYRLCGCGQHETLAIDVAVSRQGDIREIYREMVYRDATPSCID